VDGAALHTHSFTAQPSSGPPLSRRYQRRRNLKDQNQAKLRALAARMQRGSQRYRKAWWIAWEEMILPPKTRRTVVNHWKTEAIRRC